MLELKNITVDITEESGSVKRILDDVSLTLEDNSFTAITGPNGGGKSTLAKLINGLYLPTEGNIYVDDMNTKDTETIWDVRKTAGMVFQNPDNQIVATIVEEDVAFGPENLGVPPREIRKRVDNALEIVEMSKYKKHAPHLLSGGQKQRVAIAGILAMEPDCIIFDEPTAMLDPTGRKEVMDTIRKLNGEEGKTIINITHFMDEAVEGDRVLVMSDGEIVMEGTPREIFSDVEKVKLLGLDVPQVTELAYELKNEGIDISTDILTIEELVEAL